MFEEIYHDYLLHKNEVNVEERYKGNEGWYHASGAGLCSRKMYYQSVEKLQMPSKNFSELDSKGQAGIRKMALGTIIHENIQDALLYNNNIYYNTKEKKLKNTQKKEKFANLKFEVEGELTIPSLNVRGFYDVLLFDSSGPIDLIKLYDVKTMGAWQWKQIYPRSVRNEQPSLAGESDNYKLQLGTYGLAIKEKYGNLDQLAFIYYNFNSQMMREAVVPLSYTDKAKRYWHSINEEHSKGLPRFNFGVSPSANWVCNYCNFKPICKPPSFK
jgi:CRISPR/Cas system-associated exonuclease Cas4 (RecB family)